MITLLQRAFFFKNRTAIVSNKNSYTYNQLITATTSVATNLLNGKNDLCEAKIPFLIPPSFEYTAVQWGIWASGGVAVPLCVQHPLPSIQYVLEDIGSKMVIVHPDFKAFLTPLEQEMDLSIISSQQILSKNIVALPDIQSKRRAMILYTSGTTSKPKGVVTTHANIEAQITTLVNAWEWGPEDYILNILPLHHVHGIINVLNCALWLGACCEFLPKFDVSTTWDCIKSGRLSLFMAVPTIYYKLIAFWDAASETEKEMMSQASSKLRLMVSGSAALPIPVLEKWRQITGHTLLERYGMTEIGMGLSSSYNGERRAGHVGLPLPGVKLRLVDKRNRPVAEGVSGEIQIKGPSVFLEYWQKEDATKKAFTHDGWFMTGDIAVYHNGFYKILGRDSVDIIKTGGYKVSALEIEDVLRMHEWIDDCAIVGLPDPEWGEIIAACVVSKQDNIDFKILSTWLKRQLPGYKVPRRFIKKDDLPRNVLGKVTKNQLKKHF